MQQARPLQICWALSRWMWQWTCQRLWQKLLLCWWYCYHTVINSNCSGTVCFVTHTQWLLPNPAYGACLKSPGSWTTCLGMPLTERTQTLDEHSVMERLALWLASCTIFCVLRYTTSLVSFDYNSCSYTVPGAFLRGCEVQSTWESQVIGYIVGALHAEHVCRLQWTHSSLQWTTDVGVVVPSRFRSESCAAAIYIWNMK